MRGKHLVLQARLRLSRVDLYPKTLSHTRRGLARSSAASAESSLDVAVDHCLSRIDSNSPKIQYLSKVNLRPEGAGILLATS